MKPITIGIAGGTGSGKTTLVNKLKSVLGDEVVTLCHDYYYKSNGYLSLEERKKLNYDHPNAFDTDMMIAHIQQLKKGRVVEIPTYDFVQHTRTEETVAVHPKKSHHRGRDSHLREP